MAENDTGQVTNSPYVVVVFVPLIGVGIVGAIFVNTAVAIGIRVALIVVRGISAVFSCFYPPVAAVVAAAGTFSGCQDDEACLAGDLLSIAAETMSATRQGRAPRIRSPAGLARTKRLDRHPR